MFEKIVEIMVEELHVEAENIQMDTNFKEDLGVDSLDLFELVSALESEYDIEIETESLATLTTVKAVVDYLAGKGITE